jgi:hypothetical protein
VRDSYVSVEIASLLDRRDDNLSVRVAVHRYARQLIPIPAAVLTYNGILDVERSGMIAGVPG